MSTSREPVTVVELDQDFCQETYSVAPCTAALGVTGTNKCFNTLRTCQDQPNYNKGILTLRFVSPREDLPKDWGWVIPSLVAVATRPTRTEPGSGLGRRAKVTIQMQDHPYHDRPLDPYYRERNFDATKRGSFWSKWLVRNPFYQSREIRILEGYRGQSLAAMRKRVYVIESISGPDSKGNVQIVAKDILKLADDDRSKAPTPNTGKLASAIGVADTSLTLAPAGIGDAEYSASGTARIGDELCDFTRSGDTMTLDREVQGTIAKEHEQDDTVQECLVFNGAAITDTIETLLTSYANINSAYIPKVDWDADADRWLAGYSISRTISEPTGVNKLIRQIAQQTQVSIWWEEYSQTIRFRSLSPPDTIPPYIDDDVNILADSVEIERRNDDRISQVWVYYDQINPVEDQEEPRNYRKWYIAKDQDAERDIEFGDVRIMEVFANWYSANNEPQVIGMANRLLARLRDIPEIIGFTLDAKDRELVTGDVVDVSTRLIVDELGLPATIRYEIIEHKPVEGQIGHRYRYRAQKYDFVGRYIVIGPDTLPDYSAATDEQKRRYFFIAPDSGTFSDGTEAYKIT